MRGSCGGEAAAHQPPSRHIAVPLAVRCAVVDSGHNLREVRNEAAHPQGTDPQRSDRRSDRRGGIRQPPAERSDTHRCAGLTHARHSRKKHCMYIASVSVSRRQIQLSESVAQARA